MSSSIAKSIEREERLEKEGLDKPEDRRPDRDAIGDAYKGVINAGLLPPAAACAFIELLVVMPAARVSLHMA